jgi:glycosyltransferase involved in cell wall biosynthesis
VGLVGGVNTISMNNNPISVILPNYNGVKYLERAIQSFVDQTYSNKQLVIVDGKSQDGSHEVIQRFADVNPETILWLREPDQGLSDAINIGIRHCRGEVIGYLGNDDILYRDILFEVNYHLSLVNYDVIYFDSYDFYVKQNICRLRKPLAREFTRETLLRYGTIVALMNIFFRRHIFNKYQYNTAYKYAMDYEFCLRITQENYLYLYVEKIATITVLDGGITESLSTKQADEIKRAANQYRRPGDAVWFSPKRSLHKRIFQSISDLVNKP